MAQDINLLPDQTGEDKQQLRQRKLITQVSAVVLALTIVAVIGLFAAKLALQAQLDSLDKNIATQDQQIQAKKNEEGIYRALDAKLTNLSTFFTTQKHFSTFLSQFSKTVPDSMTVTDLSVTAANLATVNGKVSTYADLAGFYDKLRTAGPAATMSEDMDMNEASSSAMPDMSSLPADPYFTNPTLLSISRDEQTGTINFSVSFTLSQQVLASGATS
jgi:Tfp pilus assembly protein PilN